MFDWFKRSKPVVAAVPVEPKRFRISQAALGDPKPAFSLQPKVFPVQAPELPKGVVPQGIKAAVAMDNAFSTPAYGYCQSYFGPELIGFPGYPYLANLAMRPEYRAFASTLSTEMTREWITLISSENDDDSTKKKLGEIEEQLREWNARNVVRTAIEHDSYFGRGQILIDIDGHNRALPLAISSKTVKKGANVRLSNVEPMWTTPLSYNAIDPADPTFYKPSKWLMLGKEVHATRLLTVITRPVPDILKPAFNFSGISMSQLAEPYVNNWLRTRQSVSDLIANFSITALASDIASTLEGADDGQGLFNRVALFTQTRSNQGVMVLNKDTEELVQVNTPLSGLDHLQAQAQEHMCTVSRIPSVILTGLSPSGLNASSEGEIRVFYDWIIAQDEAYVRNVVGVLVALAQVVLYGDIDPDIKFNFNPLYQMTPKELAEIRKSDADMATALIQNGVIAPEEERERLARDPNSGYEGLDTGVTIVNPNLPENESDNEDDS